MRFSVAFAFFILLFSSFVTSAQHLRHKGSLGISYAAASDSLMSTQHLPDSHGILVKSVMPDFTAARLGIQAGDILVSINETDSLYLFDFRKLEQELYEQEPISITYIRNRKKAGPLGMSLRHPRSFQKER